MKQIYILCLLIFFSVEIIAQCPNPGFTINPSIICAGSPITFTDTTSGNNLIYSWDFSAGDLIDTPTFDNFALTGNAYADGFSIIYDDATDSIFGFASDYTNGTLTRLTFGNNIDSLTPGQLTFGISLNHAYGSDFIRVNGKWYGFICSFGSLIYRLDFDSSLNNIPMLTTLNPGGLVNSASIVIREENGNYYGFVADYGSNIIRLDFGSLITNIPVSNNLAIGGLNAPTYLTIKKFCDTWVGLIGNWNSGELTQINFATALTSTITPVSLGFLGSNSATGVDMIEENCNIYGFATYDGDAIMHKLSYGTAITNSPAISSIAGTNIHPRALKCINVNSRYRIFSPINGPNSLDRWAFPNNSGSNYDTSTVFSPNNIVYSIPGTYNISLTATDTTTGANSSFCQTIVVNPDAPSIGFIIPPSCSTLPVLFQDTTADSTIVTSWWWNFGDGGTSTAKDTTHTYLTDGTYTVTHVITINGGCTDTIVHTVVFKDEPIAMFNVTNTCVGQTVTFQNLSTCYDNMTYHWDFGDLSTSTFQNPTHSYGSAGTYNVTLVVTSDSGCVDSIIIPVTISNPSQSIISYTPPNICGSIAVNFTDTYVNPPTSYLWSFGDSFTSILTSPSHSYSTPGTYFVKLIATTGTSCIDSAFDTIAVGPGPMVSFTWDSVCVGTPVQLLDNSTTLSDTIVGYKWIFPDSSFSFTMDASFSFTTCGNNMVIHIDSTNIGCIGKDTQFVYVYCAPQVAFNYVGLCSNTLTNFTDASTSDSLSSITTWHWDFGDGNQSSLQNPTNVYINPGPYLVTLTVTNNHGCISSITDTVNILFTGPLALFNTTPALICLGTTVQFNNYSQGTIQTYLWNFGDGSSLSTLENPTHLYLNPGVDTVILTISSTNGGCISYDSIPIIIHPLPIAHFTNTTACVNYPIQFVDSGYVVNNLDSIFWSSWIFDTAYNFGDTAYYTFTTTGNHIVSLTESTFGGCSATIIDTLNILPSPISSFTFSPINGAPPLNVDFTNTSSGGNTYLWYFGDGDSSNFFDPVHIYVDTLCDTIKLFVTDTLTGCKGLFTDTICLDHNILDIAVDTVIATPNGDVLNVSAIIQNKGSEIIYYYDLTVNVAGNIVLVHLNDTLNPFGTSFYTFNQAFAVNPHNPPPYVCVTAKNPNGISPDNNPANDEQCASLLPDFQVFNIYPNPTLNTFTLETIVPYTNEIKISMYDAIGKLVTIFYDGPAVIGFNKFEFDTSPYANGVYLLSVEYQNKIIVNKLIKF